MDLPTKASSKKKSDLAQIHIKLNFRSGPADGEKRVHLKQVLEDQNDIEDSKDLEDSKELQDLKKQK